MATYVVACVCPHAAQDSLHGPGRRVFNGSGKEPTKLRCTVCGATRYNFKK